MQIRNILPGHPDPAALASRGEASEAVGTRAPHGGKLPVSAANAAATAMVEILSHYDVTDITPAEFSEMIQRLFEGGALSDKELQQLAAVRLDLELEGVEADESLDLLEFYASKIKKVQGRLGDSDDPAAGQPQLSPLLERLDWLEKFALIQSAPEAVGLDAVA